MTMRSQCKPFEVTIATKRPAADKMSPAAERGGHMTGGGCQGRGGERSRKKVGGGKGAIDLIHMCALQANVW